MKTLALALCLVVGSAIADPAAQTVSPQGQQLAEKLDAMGVESKWPALQHVNWRTGLPDREGEVYERGHTHCSAFVAAAAETLGVHILHPPEHSAKLLANAQFEWLAEEGADEGWRPLADPAAAQAAANAGELVVAAYESHRPDKPGHIAIVKPAARSEAEIAADGPLVIQAGTVNSSAISMREGFAGHPHAWQDHEARFYAHTL
jgi:hypothetical protein